MFHALTDRPSVHPYVFSAASNHIKLSENALTWNSCVKSLLNVIQLSQVEFNLVTSAKSGLISIILSCRRRTRNHIPLLLSPWKAYTKSKAGVTDNISNVYFPRSHLLHNPHSLQTIMIPFISLLPLCPQSQLTADISLVLLLQRPWLESSCLLQHTQYHRFLAQVEYGCFFHPGHRHTISNAYYFVSLYSISTICKSF